MRIVVQAIALSLGLSAISIAGCGTTAQNPTGGSTSGGSVMSGHPTGTLGMTLNIAPGITINTVQYTITNPTLAGFTTLSGSIDVSGSQNVSLSLVLPVGAGYSISLSAVDSNGDNCAGGPAMFSVLAGQSNAVALNLICKEILEGSIAAPDVNVAPVSVTADASLQIEGGTITPCAAITSLVAASAEVTVGHNISLSATGIDPAGSSSDVTLGWTATGSAGSLTATSGASTMFSCTAPGTETVKVTATVTGGISCANTGSATVTLTCDATADAGAPEAGQDAAPEAAVDTGTEAAVEAGPAAPCTATNSAPNCVQCFGNTNNVCTATEAVIVARDIAKGNLTAAGQLTQFSTGAPNAGSCYACLNHFICIDNATSGPGQECQDLPATATTLDGEPAAQACVDTLQCIVNSACSTANPTAQCFCGTASGSACLSAGAANGPCLQQEINGLDVGTCTNTFPAPLSCTEGDPTNSQKAFTNANLPAGMANTLMGCAFSNCQSQCTP